jgi:membrane protease YdiL (CAAX protease family)
METSEGSPKGIFIFLFFSFALSSVFYYLIISTGRLAVGWGLYVTGLMWCPGAAALLTCLTLKRSVSSLGWKWGRTKYQMLSYAVPIAYSALAYGCVWTLGFGALGDGAFIGNVKASFGFQALPSGLAVVLYILFQGTIGMAGSCSRALGEEIGWRGFLVPELAKTTTFTKTALISGVIWSVWHYPILLFADYNSGTPWWYGLSCFTVMVIAMSYVFAWMRLRSGSLWTGMFLHASHNLFVQSIFDPLTGDTGQTKYIVGEFGIALTVSSVIFAFIFWRNRSSLPAHALGLDQKESETEAGSLSGVDNNAY